MRSREESDPILYSQISNNSPRKLDQKWPWRRKTITKNRTFG